MSWHLKSLSICMVVSAAAVSIAAVAAPVEFDTTDAHVIVVRPVDVWSGEAGRSDDTLSVVRRKKFNYTLHWDGASLSGGPYSFFGQGVSDAPVITTANAKLRDAGFEMSRTQDYRFFINRAVDLAPAEYPVFRKREEELLQEAVLSLGDPRTLRARVSRAKVVGGVASLATLGLLAQVGGTAVANASLHTGLIGDVYQANQSGLRPESPALLPDFDTTGFVEIEVRRVGFVGDMIGQVVIAYRTPKSDDAQREAITRAIVSLAGADTTPEAIEQARAEDYAWRLAQWDACVAASKCVASKP